MTPSQMNNPWTDDLIGELRRLWDLDTPTAEIARRLRLSKNQVLGKVHRLKLPPRPSPIRAILARQAGDAAPTPRRASPRRIAKAAAPVQKPPETEQASPAPLAVPPQVLGQCCFPLGEPGTRSFRFCDEPVMARRRIYCEAHDAVAFVRVSVAA